MSRLKGKVALVTGAARGIRAAIAQAMVDEGAKVVIGDVAGMRKEDIDIFIDRGRLQIRGDKRSSMRTRGLTRNLPGDVRR